MPKLAATSWLRELKTPEPWPFRGNPTVHVAAGGGKAGALAFFVLGAPVGARIAWPRCLAGVRGGFPDANDTSAQIGPFWPPHPLGCVGLLWRRNQGTRRSASDRGFWRPGLQRPGHLAGTQKTGLCATSQPGPAPCVRGMASDRLTRQRPKRIASSRPQEGRLRSGWCLPTQFS